MDLNELLHAHQVEVMRAAAAGDRRGRDGHFAKVAEYAELVRKLRDMSHQKPSPSIENGPETIIYGTYAGDVAKPPVTGSIDSWEDEGGALDPPEVMVPDGVTTKIIRHFHVGPYVYQDLDLAVAEHLRQLSEPE